MHFAARLPFLDHELVEYAAQIPPSLKVRYSQEGVACEKWILKEAMRPFITDEIYQRTKHMYLVSEVPSTAPGPSF